MDSACGDLVAVTLLVEGTSVKVGQSPIKRQRSFAQGECFSPIPKVATPLRGCKRAVSDTSLAQPDGPAKVRLIEQSPVGFNASPRADIQEQMPTSGVEGNEEQHLPLRVAYLRRRLADVRSEFETSGRVDPGQVDVRSEHARLGSLEAYKKELDSTTKFLACDDCTREIDEDAYAKRHFLAQNEEAEHEDHAEHTDANWNTNEDVELQDTVTTWMDYSRRADGDEQNLIPQVGVESEQECCCDSHDATGASTHLKITLGYQDAESGVMMCYHLCDNHDEDLQAMRAMWGEETEQMEDKEESDRESLDSQSSTTEESLSNNSADMPWVDEQHLDTAWQENCVWQDETSGTILAYAVCDDETEEEAIQLGAHSTVIQHGPEEVIGVAAPLQITLGYPDAATGVMMCYQLCDDEDVDLQAVRAMCQEGEAGITEETEGSDWESSDIQRSSEDECCLYSGDEEPLTRLSLEDTVWQGNYEWEDQTSGTILAYAVCDDETEEEARQLGAVLPLAENNSLMIQHDSEDDIGASAPWQITIGYRDAATGVMMCYQLCDDSDEDLQTLRAMCEEDAERTEDGERDWERSDIQSSSEEESFSNSGSEEYREGCGRENSDNQSSGEEEFYSRGEEEVDCAASKQMAEE